jgi:hypothetical protein
VTFFSFFSLTHSAIQFACYDRYKEYLFGDKDVITPVDRLIAGALAGATAQVVTYPLDFMRARLAVDMKGTSWSILCQFFTN